MDPTLIIMLVLIVVMIFFMFRNGKKRQQAAQQMQDRLRPGAEVMLQSGIYGTVESVDSEENRVTVRSGTSTLVVHRNAIGQVVTPVDAPATTDVAAELAPDDDPAFGERIANPDASGVDGEIPDAGRAETDGTAPDGTETDGTDTEGPEGTPKA